MAFKVLSGPYLNHLTRTASAPAMSPAAHSLFPSSNAHDNRSSKPAIFSAAMDDSTFEFDLNLVKGDMESTGETGDWTVLGVGQLQQTSVDPFEGGGCGMMVLGTGATEAIVYKDVIGRPGERLNLAAAINPDVYGAAGQVRLRNRQTGNWLSSSGGWTSSLTAALMASTSSGWAYKSLQFQVESVAVTRTDEPILRVYLRSTSNSVKFDAVQLYPSLNWVSVHGHNIPPCIVPTIEYSTDGSSWTTYSTMTLRRDSFYHVFSSGLSDCRRWRLLFDGQPDTDSLMYMGEVVLGQSFDLLQNPEYSGSLRWTERQTRLESDIGDMFISLHNQTPVRTLLLNFTFPSSTEYDQFRNEIYRGSRGGGNLICVAPVEMDDSVVILGRVRDSIDVAKHTPLLRTSLLEVVESPLPNAPGVASVYDAAVTGGE